MIEIALGILLAIFLLYTIELWGPIVWYLILVSLAIVAGVAVLGFFGLVLIATGG